MVKDRFFGNKYGYEYIDWDYGEDLSNNELFNKLVTDVKEKLDDEVYYKDYSFLGFGTYPVLCPKLMTETAIKNNMLVHTGLVDRGKFEEYMFNKEVDLKGLTNLDYTELNVHGIEAITGRTSKYTLDSKFIQGYIEFLKGNYAESSRLLWETVPYPKNNLDDIERDYFMDCQRVLINYIGMLGSISDKEEIKYILEKMYHSNIVNTVEYLCDDPIRLTDAIFLDRHSPY